MESHIFFISYSTGVTHTLWLNCMGKTGSKYISVLDKMGAAAEWTEPRGTLRSRLRATLSRPPGAPLPVLLPRNILKRLRRRRGGHSTRYLSRGARWTIACDAQKRGLLAHLGFINWAQAQDLLVD